jgi:hypothetical protein
MGAQVKNKQKKIILSTAVDNKIHAEDVGNNNLKFIIVVFHRYRLEEGGDD